ncbi:hypothetical protein BAE44_0000169 [Dichanthelium oligosanthes]|uniref:Uncharacterized protein n=1 Tax=Dichanthelium oligosanthes TaxID=888268 RepID=A0A1E5WN25_9POAL|nr:hypothetical protein BAE44_0000169 [Dichanthelium oligosanthes]
MPALRKPKRMPFSLAIPRPDVDDHYGSGKVGSNLFIMESFPEPELRHRREQSDQFEAFINRLPNLVAADKAWHCDLLPPPPFVREACHWSNNNNRPEITA